MIQQYEKYKKIDAGQWLQSIPFHWNTAFLSALFDEHKYKNKGMQCSNLLSLSYGRIVHKDINSKAGLLPESFETYNIIDDGDIVLRLTDLQNDHRSLRTALSHENGIVTSAYVALRARTNKISPAYYHYFLHAFDTHKCFYGMGEGVRQNLSYDGIKKLVLAVPPIDEQNQIVKFLDYKTHLINQLVKCDKYRIQLLVEYMNSLFAEARNRSMKYVKLKNLVSLNRNYITPIANQKYKKAGMYNRGRGIFSREPVSGSDLGDSQFQRITRNCLMISGQFAWEDATYVTTEKDEEAIASHRYYFLKVISEVITPEYLWAYFMSDEGFAQLNICSHGSAGRNRPLNITELLNSEIPRPFSDGDVSKITESAHLIMAHRLVDKGKTELWDEYKTSLISDVVTGKVDVRNVEVPEYEAEANDAADED
ncbi:restriction endonuclease subunit S [Clostridium tyrobutyricum]|uniref:restriction endonuclease subunit S n=1 Tax=Clostridium tyrobutyricum TaxID=1519 RepID=UPI0030D2E882